MQISSLVTKPRPLDIAPIFRNSHRMTNAPMTNILLTGSSRRIRAAIRSQFLVRGAQVIGHGNGADYVR